MTQASLFGEPTYRVSQLAEEIKLFLSEAFPAVWVTGEVQRLRPSRRGHVYFELVEKGHGDAILGRLDAVVWRSEHERLQRRLGDSDAGLAEGLEIRCRVRVDFYPAGGRLQVMVQEIDPVFSLGTLERRRRETLEALAAAGLLDRNPQLPLPRLPLDLGLVTSHDSAAYHDVLSTLSESPYGFRVVLVHAAVQGREAEREVPSALRFLAGRPLDCVAVVRGGGARSDLAAFDSRRIAEAVARHPVPVLTGLGHETDRSVSDRVAHTALNTPTRVAEFLVRRVEEQDLELAGRAGRLGRRAQRAVREAASALDRCERRLVASGHQVAQAQARVRDLGRLLGVVAGQSLLRARGETRRLAGRLAWHGPREISKAESRQRSLVEEMARRAGYRLDTMRRACDAWQRLCDQLSPERTLARGFSITRTIQGRLVRRARELAPGERLESRLAEGVVISRVEES